MKHKIKPGDNDIMRRQLADFIKDEQDRQVTYMSSQLGACKLTISSPNKAYNMWYAAKCYPHSPYPTAAIVATLQYSDVTYCIAHSDSSNKMSANLNWVVCTPNYPKPKHTMYFLY
jgi:hypothetical protein